VKDVFISAAERDIYTGDAIVLNVITKDGVKVETFPLRRD
jgi:20S proteasome subunit beta 6